MRRVHREKHRDAHTGNVGLDVDTPICAMLGTDRRIWVTNDPPESKEVIEIQADRDRHKFGRGRER